MFLKKLVVPILVLSAAVVFSNVGCDSDSSTTGTAGTGGGAGTSGAAGTGTAGTGSAGTGSAGTGAAGTGSAGTGAAGTGAAGTGAAGTGAAGTGAAGTGAAGTGAAGTGAAGTGGDTIPACPSAATMANNTTKVSKEVFCKNFLKECSNLAGFTIPAGYATEAACEASWDANTAAVGCRSYHLCGNAVGQSEAARKTHCPHALGMGACTN
jgi:hypothetical protein